jgi:flagellar M-ring protein FliF
MSTNPLTDFLAQAKSWWEGASQATRIGAAAFAAAVVIALGMAIMLASAPNFEDLFSNLSPDDAAAIAAKLDDEHVKYQMADNDTTVLVPAADKDRLRMEMVRAGLPAKTGSVLGTEWLDKIGMSTTSDVQDQYINLANEGELARTIGTISSIASASVHISPGDNTPFAVQTSPTTASAVIGLKPGESLTSDQIMGIASLISKSVPNLDIKNVAVIDSDGNQLWTGGDDPNGPGGSASGKISAELAFSETMRKQMQSYLDLVLGPHKALVSVDAELNYNQVKSEQTSYTKGAPVSEQETDEKYSGEGSDAPGLVSGTAANTPGGTAPSYPNPSVNATGKTGSYQSSGGTTNYDNNVTQTDTQQAQGSIQRLAVGVLIDSSIPGTTVSSIQNYLSTLAGVTASDPTRAVTVQPIPFSNVVANQETAETATEAGDQNKSEIIKIAAVIAVVGFLLFIFMKTSGVRKVEQAVHELPEFEPREFIITNDSAGEQMISEGPVRLEDVLDEMPEPVRRPKRRSLIPEIEEHSDVKLASIKDMIQSKPNSVALLMKGWMSEDSGV